MSKLLRGLILLDGADACGKTTLADRIQKVATTLGATAEIHHLGKPDRGTAWAQQSEAIMKYLHMAFVENKLIIADRHFLSEAIYGCAYREGSEYPYAARHVDRLLHRFRALRVICAPPIETTVANHAKMKEVRKEEYDDGMDKVARRYIDLWRGASGPDYSGHDYIQALTAAGGVHDRLGWYHYDFTKQGDGDLYARLLCHEMMVESELMPVELLDPEAYQFTGFPSKQSTLIVGSDVPDNMLSIPFWGNSGLANNLARVFQALGVNEGRVVLCRPDHLDQVKTLQGMCKRTVAMGREAERELLHYGVAFDGVFYSPNILDHEEPEIMQRYLSQVVQALMGIM